MRITSRRKAIYLFITLGAFLVAVAVALNVSWIILNWRESVKLLLGAIFFLVIIAGMILNTIFLVREIRRNEQHDSFINAVTHELKTPIASIRLYLETLQRREVDEAKRQEFYRSMLLDTDRLIGTVEQVLKAGEAGLKRGKLHKVAVPLDDLVRECVDLARTRHHLPPEGMTLRELANGTRPVVAGDPEDLRTAINNILDNAVKYSPGGVRVEVDLDSTDPRLASLRVLDHGEGIPTDELKRVFKRFYRVQRSLKRVKGTGLGLFIVNAIVRQHGGRVFAESEGEGKGSTVIITLPRSAG